MASKELWSEKMADTVMKKQWPVFDKWAYEWGVVLKGIENLYIKTGKKEYFDYIKAKMDDYIDENGNIKKYKLDEFNIDHVNNGKLLFFLYARTNDEKYKKAAYLLREQIKKHPRTKEGGFWHKKIYPNQMWLDGLYMGAPFYAEFGKTFDEPAVFDDVAKQVILMDKYARDKKTGLLYHGWDESKEEAWSNKENGCSPNFWGRAMGWYCVAIVDILDFLPENHSDRNKLISIFETAVEALVKFQDSKTGLWYQVLDKGGKKGNYFETSATSMFVYAFIKAVRKGYIAKKYLDNAKKAYDSIIKNFVFEDGNGFVILSGVCGVAGLGNKPYRDGSYEYYINEPVVPNDFKGVGAFILASFEIENI
jgi:unsaturated rhamnogalacturonyl hydrolase